MSSKTAFNAARFNNEDAARKYLEAMRWPNGPICPHCGAYERISPLKGKTQRPGLYWCGDCREQFTVTVGTVIERSKVPLTKWVLCAHLMMSSKKGMSSHQIHRILGVTYKTAWFMTHRLREASRLMGLTKMGGGGGIVEADETYWGTSKEALAAQKKKGKKLGGGKHKMKIFSLVERGGTLQKPLQIRPS